MNNQGSWQTTFSGQKLVMGQEFTIIEYYFILGMVEGIHIILQSELTRPILLNQTSEDVHQGSYLDTLSFDNVTLTLHRVMLTSQKPC